MNNPRAFTSVCDKMQPDVITPKSYIWTPKHGVMYTEIQGNDMLFYQVNIDSHHKLLHTEKVLLSKSVTECITGNHNLYHIHLHCKRLPEIINYIAEQSTKSHNMLYNRPYGYTSNGGVSNINKYCEIDLKWFEENASFIKYGPQSVLFNALMLNLILFDPVQNICVHSLAQVEWNSIKNTVKLIITNLQNNNSTSQKANYIYQYGSDNNCHFLVATGNQIGHTHQWRKYIGITHTFEYCELCDVKK